MPHATPVPLGPYRLKDYDRLPEGSQYELIYGWFFPTVPVPGLLHQTLAQVLFLHLDRIAERAGGFAYMAPTEVLLKDDEAAASYRRVTEKLFPYFAHLADETGGAAAIRQRQDKLFDSHSVLRPDVLYVAKGRRSVLQERAAGRPDLIVEVLPPVPPRDLKEKAGLYAAEGLSEYWIADPHERKIEFYRNDHGRFVAALPAEGVYQSATVPEVTLDVAALWERFERRLPPDVPR
jgi:Uma2 family endonuclease